MADALELYNEACDMIASNGRSTKIIKCLRVCREILEGQPALSPEESELYARANVLYGQLCEWCDPADSRRCYQTAIMVDDDYAEGHLQLARSLWRDACCADDIIKSEHHLRKAVDCDLYDSDDESESDGLAKKLLARLLLTTSTPHSVRYDEACTLLVSMGFKYTFSPLVLGHAEESLGMPRSLPRSHARKSARVEATMVTASDAVLPPCMLAYLKRIFDLSSPFWHDHSYDSPSTGFFSYQVTLPPFSSFPLADTQCPGEGVDAALSGTEVSSFERVLHHLWRATCLRMPHVKRARYAEWWAHSRPHSNGHLLHYDYIAPSSPENLPVHPLATSILYVTANCGGPTLVTNETIKNPRTHHGWLISPAENRVATFRGSQLHCVLPGRGECSQKNARRITLMIAFYDENPRAPPFPVVSCNGPANKKMRYDSTDSGGHTWPRLFAEPITPHKCSCASTASVPQTSGGIQAAGKAVSKQRRAHIGSAEMRRQSTAFTDCSQQWLSDQTPDHCDGITPVSQVYIRLKSSQDASGSNKTTPHKKLASISLLDDSMFAQFDALNSGLLLTETGVCSLNCGGTCPMCKAAADQLCM